jgi:hypothetical protein
MRVLHGGMTPEDRNAELEAEHQRQREQIAALLGRVRELESRLAHSTAGHVEHVEGAIGGMWRDTISSWVLVVS